MSEASAKPQPAAAQTVSELQKLQSELSAQKEATTQMQPELQKLKLELSAQKEAQETIRTWIQILAGVLIVVSFLAFGLQVYTLWAEARSRRRNQEESAAQSRREEELHNRFLKVLDVASKAQDKVATLEEGGIKKAGETLELINSLLTITERAAARAAGAQFDFLSRRIETLDGECKRLIANAARDDDRDIIAKPAFSEQVRVLAELINSLDHEISTYNASVPPQFRAAQQYGDQAGTGTDHGTMPSWTRLSLTGPCLFIRGQNHLQLQNFKSAIDNWKSSLEAKDAESIKVDANYWIGYLNNTLGNFDVSPDFFKAAAKAATEQRKPELLRLELETRFFALDLAEVPNDLLCEGAQIYNGLQRHRVPTRTISSFATTMGNITLIQGMRAAITNGSTFEPAKSSEWFQHALDYEPRSRWARFGKCQNLALSGQSLDENTREEVRDVLGSVQREYQARIEDRSKVLSKVTEYICLVMLGDQKEERLSTVAASVESHASLVRARTIYSQFRKQNVDKEVFLEEFHFFEEKRNLPDTFRMANTKKQQ